MVGSRAQYKNLRRHQPASRLTGFLAKMKSIWEPLPHRMLPWDCEEESPKGTGHSAGLAQLEFLSCLWKNYHSIYPHINLLPSSSLLSHFFQRRQRPDQPPKPEPLQELGPLNGDTGDNNKPINALSDICEASYFIFLNMIWLFNYLLKYG